MTPFIAKLVWWAGVIGWFVIRYPHQRRSRKTPIASRRERLRERLLLSVSFTGLFIVPVIYSLLKKEAPIDFDKSIAEEYGPDPEGNLA